MQKTISLPVAKYFFDFEKNIYFKRTDLFSTPEDQNGVELICAWRSTVCLDR